MSDNLSIFKTTDLEKQYLEAYEAVLKLWGVPHEALDVTTRFGCTHINAAGPKKRPALLLLPGFGANSSMWFPNVAALSSQFRVYAVDTNGQPGKSLPALTLTAANSPDWIAEVMDKLGLKKAHLVGVSLGGWLALRFAIENPARADHVVMLDPAASFAPMSAIWLAHTFFPFMVHPSRPGLLKYFRWLTRGFKVDPHWGELMLLGILNTRPQPPIRATPFTDSQLRSVQAPVLALIGGRSLIYDPGRAHRRAIQFLPNVQAEIVPDASHALIEESSNLVNSRILQFCQS